MFNRFLSWIPLGIAITFICGLIYLTGQQALRMGANDPQIQVSEDIADSLANGLDAASILRLQTVDLAKSLAVYIMVFNDKKETIVSTATLDGKIPSIPLGILDYAKSHTQNRLTWQPKTGIREAVVVTHFKGKRSGFVLVGRSLLEIEKRENQLLLQVGVIWIASILTTFVASFLIRKNKK